MPALCTFVRALCCVVAGSLVLLADAAVAQQGGIFAYRWTNPPTAEMITPGDIREALIWTGHLQAVFKGQAADIARKAAQAWQKSKGHPPSETLPDAQMVELVSDGLKERDDVGWSVLRDSAVGIAVGFPAKLVTFAAPHTEGSALYYHGGGELSQSLGVHLGSPSCVNLDGAYLRITAGATYRARQDNWFMGLFRRGEISSYIKATCYGTGTITAEMAASADTLAKHPGLFGAMFNSLALLRSPDPTIRPRPKVEELPLSPAGAFDDEDDHPQDKDKGKDRDKATAVANTKPRAPTASAVDGTGKTAALKLEIRDGTDLRADEVFEMAAGAVYKVRTERGLGSAVAISDSELLTNCHVVGDFDEVKIVRAKEELVAQVVSKNADADRCILHAPAKLPKWVTVRPYDDIKVGERAVTIGTPQGLELTVAEGIVSSKRVFNHRRVIQTSAPISQGSSGGGLFDARGHLLGITTFFLKAGQNLNFALAAEDFAQPHEDQAVR